MSSSSTVTKTVEEKKLVAKEAFSFDSLYKFKIPEAKYGVLLTALALSLIYIDGAPLAPPPFSLNTHAAM
jgi:hypothetical protein